MLVCVRMFFRKFESASRIGKLLRDLPKLRHIGTTSLVVGQNKALSAKHTFVIHHSTSIVAYDRYANGRHFQGPGLALPGAPLPGSQPRRSGCLPKGSAGPLPGCPPRMLRLPAGAN